jgi:hypothetical protein
MNNLAQLAEVGKDYIQVALPVALALLVYRQSVIEKAITELKASITEIRNIFIGHLSK